MHATTTQIKSPLPCDLILLIFSKFAARWSGISKSAEGCDERKRGGVYEVRTV